MFLLNRLLLKVSTVWCIEITTDSTTSLSVDFRLFCSEIKRNFETPLSKRRRFPTPHTTSGAVGFEPGQFDLVHDEHWVRFRKPPLLESLGPLIGHITNAVGSPSQRVDYISAIACCRQYVRRPSLHLPTTFPPTPLLPLSCTLVVQKLLKYV
jgi:hypothetical protein